MLPKKHHVTMYRFEKNAPQFETEKITMKLNIIHSKYPKTFFSLFSDIYDAILLSI